MTVLWISLVAILLFVILGYRRGVLRMVAFIGALLLAGLTAWPLGTLLLPLVQRMGFIPRTLQPLVAPVAAALIILIVLDGFASWLLKCRERSREAQNLPRLEPWERFGGAVLGGLWGCSLVALVLTGMHFLGRVEEELARASVPAPQLAENPRTVPVPIPAVPVAPKTLYARINTQIDASPLASIIQRINPSEERIARIFGDLAFVTRDELMLARFRNHPAITRLTNLPQLQELSHDGDIQGLLENHRYSELLDHPKLAALLQDKALVAECRQLDLEAVLAEVQKPTR